MALQVLTDSIRIVTDDFANHTLITIPAGRMRGDVDGDGKITQGDAYAIQNGTGSAGKKYFNLNLSTTFPDGNVPLDYLAADVDNNGLINASDYNYIYSIMNGVNKAGACTEITGNWTNNPNYATEDGQFYTDIPITGITSSHSASVIVKGIYESGFFTKAECVEGAIRIYAKLCPIEALSAVVSWGTGDGTAVITTESIDLTVYAEHIANADIHVTADEKAVWSEKEVFIAEYEVTTGEEIKAAIEAGKICFIDKGDGLSILSYYNNDTMMYVFYNKAYTITLYNGEWTLEQTVDLPSVSPEDAGKVLMVDDYGNWTAAAITNAEGVAY